MIYLCDCCRAETPKGPLTAKIETFGETTYLLCERCTADLMTWIHTGGPSSPPRHGDTLDA